MKKSLLRNAFYALALSFLTFGTASWLGGCSDNSVQPESVAPSQPINLTVVQVDTNTVDLAWTASTDNVVVAGYNVFRGDTFPPPPVLIGTTPVNSFRDTTLVSGSIYEWTVQAFDCSGNLSALSDPVDTGTIGPPPSDTLILRSASTYGIFSAAGITSTGNTVVNGD
ncbi:MAG TPA: fibronectin type III domain-containing protein, partial [candidate division Zixibacteria bacterium]|nr:fibronectin type III domain-containing protein [candidate division Zixibacteria bacterium]